MTNIRFGKKDFVLSVKKYRLSMFFYLTANNNCLILPIRNEKGVAISCNPFFSKKRLIAQIRL